MSPIQRRAANRAASPDPWRSDSWVPYHSHSASLRIMDAGARHDEIARVTGLTPSTARVAGEPKPHGRGGTNPVDVWLIQSPLDDSELAAAHLAWLWEQAEPHLDSLRSLIADGATIDVGVYYTSDCDHCGFDLAPGSMRLSDALGVILGVSTIIVGRG